MKDKATLLFLTVIAYVAVAACLFPLTPLASPAMRVSLQATGNPAPAALTPTPEHQAYRHHHSRSPGHRAPTPETGAPSLF